MACEKAPTDDEVPPPTKTSEDEKDSGPNRNNPKDEVHGSMTQIMQIDIKIALHLKGTTPFPTSSPSGSIRSNYQCEIHHGNLDQPSAKKNMTWRSFISMYLSFLVFVRISVYIIYFSGVLYLYTWGILNE